MLMRNAFAPPPHGRSMLKEGDQVFLLDEGGRRFWLELREGMVKVANLGVVDAGKMIGREDGSQVAVAGRSFTVFKALANDLMEGLERGPQIITPKDAATIVFRLGLRSGDTVVEAGAGSGALTLALLNAVLPSGRLVTMEIRPDFADRAKRNVSRLGPGDGWELKIGDIRNDDPGVVADAVALDMPDPQLALDNVDKFLRPGGRIAAYVPNTNQVADVWHGLEEHGYKGIAAVENIQRAMDVHPGGVRPAFDTLAHTGYIVLGRKTER